MPNANVRLNNRYEIKNMIGERQGMARYTGLDHASNPPQPVVIVMAHAVQPGDPLLDAASGLDEEIMPTFDDDIGFGTPADKKGPAYPSLAWEKDLLSRAKHAALPTVVEEFSDLNYEYLVLSGRESRSLWDMWDEPEFDSATRYGWLIQIAEAMDALHAAGAMLEAVRPDIVGVTAQGQVVINDLSELLPLPLTSSAQVKGTLYTAPELIVSPHQADARAALYSFGAMLYSLEYLHHTLEEKDFEKPYQPKQISDRFPDVHPLFLRLINKTFCRDLNTRFPTDEASKTDATGFKELIKTLGVCKRSFDLSRLDIACWSTTGMVRTGNEDAFTVLHGTDWRQDELHEYAMVLLADGMGGYEAGEVAAAMAMNELRKYLVQRPMFSGLFGYPPAEPINVDAIKKELDAALRHVNKEVFNASRDPKRGRRGMGCTAEAVYVDTKNVIVGHVGDSRVYHLHQGRLIQLTRDQTLVYRLVELGQLSEEEAENHPRKNELQQAIGGQPDVQPGTYAGKLKRGDWVLVCSDGLTNHITNKELEQMMTRETNNSAEETARRLLNLVNLRGATDNATVVVIRAS
jgi:protein phosphatase